MNNLAYSSQDPAKVAPKVEEVVRADLRAAGPVPYRVEAGDAGPTGLGSALSDAFKTLVGGRPALLFTVHFDLDGRRQATLDVHLDRQGIGCHSGSLLYSARTAKPVGGEVTLENPKTFGKSKFTGDPETAKRLNASSDLLKRVGKFARTEGYNHLRIERLFKVVPDPAGSQVIAATLPRLTKMGMSASTDANEFLDLVAAIEAAL